MRKVIPFVVTLTSLFLLLSCSPTVPAPVPNRPQTTATVRETAAAPETQTPTEAAQGTAPTEAAQAGATLPAIGQAPTPAAPPATPAPPPTPAPTATPLPPLPPLVLRSQPEPGQEQPLDAPIELTFDQPMDRASVEKAFAIEPGASADGAFTWIDDRTVQFAWPGGFQRGERYRVRVVETAQSQAGLPMAAPFEKFFSAVGFLAVTNVQPAAGTTEVLPDTAVTVMFNRPVVPLSAIENQAGLPQPLTFVPPVTGEGEWLNTATYRFTPAGPGFEPATQYTARVAQGLTDTFGQAVLADDFEWTFNTVSPAAVASSPASGDLYVSPSPVISVAFNQRMDRQSVEQNLVVVDAASGEMLTGRFTWADSGLTPPAPGPDEVTYDPQTGQPITPNLEPVGVETVAFSPAQPLAPAGEYQILLPQGVLSERGAATAADYTAAFTVAPRLEVASSNPANGERFADIWQGLDITFSAPVSPATVILGQTLVVTGDTAIAATDVYSYWSNSNTTLGISFPRRENSSYTVNLTTGILDRYGQPLRQAETITWQTLRQSPYVYLVSPKVATYNGYRPETYVYMTVRNVNQVNFELYRLSPEDFLQLSKTSYRGWQQSEWDKFKPREADLVGRWQQPTSPETFVNYVYKVDVGQAAAGGQPLPPGLYYLEAFARPEDFYAEAQQSDPSQAIDRQILIVSRHNLTVKRGEGDALAWLTDLQSGQPVSNVPLTFVGPDGQSQTGTTDGEGVAVFTFEPPADTFGSNVIVWAGSPSQPGQDFAVASSDWNAGIAAWDFENLYGQGQSFGYVGDYASAVYTERRLYRPGQTVYFKGIVRADDDARYTIPTQPTTATVMISDAVGREVYSQTLPINDMGTVNGSFVLDEEASLGNYNIEMRYDFDPTTAVGSSAYNGFNVAEYRKPEFLVEAGADKAEYTPGENIQVNLRADFFTGGPVANAQVRWTLLSDAYYFEYQGKGFYDFTNEPDSQANTFNPAYGYGFGEQIASGSGVTDAGGRFSLAVPADLTGRLTSQTYTFDLAVTGLNNQEVATQVRVIVHKGEFYVGLRPGQYVGQTGQPNDVEVITVDWTSQPVPGQEVELVFARHVWYSSQVLDPEASRVSPDDQFYWRNLVEDQAIYTTTVTTGPDGRATATFTPDEGGNYKIYARAVDRQGHELFASVYTWVSGYQYVNWGQADHDRIELVADKPEYNTGDTATILVPHPYSGTVTALVTLERGHIYDHFVTQLDTNSASIPIPITAEMSPNIYVSVMVMQGMNGPQDAARNTQLPSFKLGYTRLNISAAEKTLTIELTPSPPENGESYQPGQKVTFDVKVTDFKGEPVKAELSLALIDKAVLTLAPEITGQLLNAFWSKRYLDVVTGSGLTLALDRINRALDERKGGGGGDGQLGPDSVRQNFADTALWVADLRTDASGQGRVEVTLPDNLTTWVLLAKGVSGADTLVGEARTEIITSKPLLVRPVAPRFFVSGDQVRLGLIIQNNTADRLEVEPGFEAEGLTIQAVNGQASVPIEGGQELKLEYDVVAGLPGTARLTMRARTAQLSDAVAFELPVYALSTPETVGTAGVVDQSGARLEGIALPQTFAPGQGGLAVSVEPSLAAGLRAGLTYLEHFPYECTEQTVSRFLPNIFTYRAYRELELQDASLAAELPRQVNVGLQKLYSQQHYDGGWGWWANDASDPTLTAYVLLGLVEARRADFSVAQWVIDNAVNFLQPALVAPKDIAEPWQANQQAFILYVLAEAGQADFSRMAALAETREQLDWYGRAFLAMGMHLADPTAAQIDTLLGDLNSAAVSSAAGTHWEEGSVDYRAMNTDIRSTAIIVAALARIRPDFPLLPQAVRWLMTARQAGGHWSTTQENAWAIIGLTDWLKASGELQAKYTWQVTLNGQPLKQGQVDPANLAETVNLRVEVADLLTEVVNRLTFERDTTPPASGGGEGGGNLYYSAYLTYYKPVEQVKALANGIVVSRQYSLYTPTPPAEPLPVSVPGQAPEPEKSLERGPAISEAKVGDFIQVRLTLIAPTDLHYVVVEDYLPAGAEAVNSSLATTSLMAGQTPELRQGGRDEPFGWWYFTHTDLRDEKAVLFATYLPAGVYEYTYTVRAATPGEYRVIPATAAQMYYPDVFGRSDGGVFKITE